jgi:pimeloyl-ACP methyl ester carboxylesterase
VALSPPGFGGPVPEGFGATSDEYVAWLAAQLEANFEPVDLVGYDWGGGHMFRLACQQPELLRSWTTDIGGCFDAEYVWHDAAQAWQTPDVGEQAVAQMAATPTPPGPPVRCPRSQRVPYRASCRATAASARSRRHRL